jgi:hypothetical protein
VTDPSLTVGVWRTLGITVFGTYQDASRIMRKTLYWKRSRISVFEVEAVPDWFEHCFVYENVVARGEF